MRNIVLMISNYFHDLAVALLASNVIVIYILGRYLDGQDCKNAVVGVVVRKLSRLTYWALAYVLVAGAVRAWFFMDFEWNPAVGKGQVAALIVKHILLFAITTLGIIVHVRYVRKYGQSIS
ncbi:MAG: hypothetical protein HY851_04615 [candidate division Zixibacteria bacterium]|nr:hypothetical protein [candidate division Zixibacteria bacterium]